jgi:hypothetical protein
MFENFRASRKFGGDPSYRKHKNISHQARQVRKGSPTKTPGKFDLTWRSSRALREMFSTLLVAALPRWATRDGSMAPQLSRK